MGRTPHRRHCVHGRCHPAGDSQGTVNGLHTPHSAQHASTQGAARPTASSRLHHHSTGVRGPYRNCSGSVTHDWPATRRTKTRKGPHRAQRLLPLTARGSVDRTATAVGGAPRLDGHALHITAHSTPVSINSSGVRGPCRNRRGHTKLSRGHAEGAATPRTRGPWAFLRANA
jgi:hypothetical protein